jgi:Skp family chaperone for outer membrane proteins
MDFMMNTFRLIISFAFILITAAFAFAQAEKPQTVFADKIPVINSNALEDEKTGITDFIEICKKLEEEFKPQSEELKTIYEKLQKLFKEFEKANRRCNESIHCSEKDAEEALNKLEEYKSLSDESKSKQEAAKSLFDKRKAELSKEVNKKITVALNQFAKEKGYTLIFDSRMRGCLIDSNFDSNEKFNDITNEFIKFYNEIFVKIKAR